MRRRYNSDSYATAKARRLRRIESRACFELQQAYASGRLSLRQYDFVSRCPKTQQRRIIEADQRNSIAVTLAAQTINQFLDSMEPGTPLSLRDVAAAIVSGTRHSFRSFAVR
jgi:hypothetical protein